MFKLSKHEPDSLNYTETNNKLKIIFILTVLVPWFEIMIENFLMKIFKTQFFDGNSFKWINYLFIPIVLYAGVIGRKYRKMGFKGRKIEIASIIVTVCLLIYGYFYFEFNPNVDYSKINDYKNIINVTLPEDGKLTINKFDYYAEGPNGTYTLSSSDDIVKENANPDDIVYLIIRADYSKQDTTALEKSIKENNNWFINTDLTEDLKKLFTNVIKYTEGNYLSIYNATTKEYNTPVTSKGEYKIYVMKYMPDSKTLEIHSYTYTHE